MYTIAEFRLNMRKAFEDSFQGHEVVIERYGQKFQLIALVDEPLKGHAFESTPEHVVHKETGQFLVGGDAEPKKKNKPISQAKITIGKTVEEAAEEKSLERCKHGAFPEYCKYAKIVNGKKVCK